MLHSPAASVNLSHEPSHQPGTKMQTVDKAMKLLGFFTLSAPEIGLSELARLAGFDKAATRRFLVALAKHGFIEQNPNDRKYRLGPAFLRFSRIREANMPLSSIIQPALDHLAAATGETAHAALFRDATLSTIAVAEPQRATRVSVDPSQSLPLHATASGLCCLAFMDDRLAKDLLRNIALERHTSRTLVRIADLTKQLETIRRRGFARAERTFEDEVIGTAVPIFGGAGKPLGTLAVAAMASRFTKEADNLIVRSLLEAAVEATDALGGQPHGRVFAALKARFK